MRALKEYQSNTYYGYFIKVTGNFPDGELATFNIQHDSAMRGRIQGSRSDWANIVKRYTSGLSKVVDFEIIEHEKTCFISTVEPWALEDSEFNYDQINNAKEKITE